MQLMRTIILLTIILLAGCAKSKCDLPDDYENIDDFPAVEDISGTYKLLDDTSQYRIILDNGSVSEGLKIQGSPPWCGGGTDKELTGKWTLVSVQNHFSPQDYGIMMSLNSGSIGLGQFLVKKYNGEYALIMPWDSRIIEDCDDYLSVYATSCEFKTFVKEK